MRQALLVIDAQNDIVGSAFRADDVIANVAALVDHARGAGIPVIWVQHNDRWLTSGTAAWQIVSALQPAPDEPRIDKQYRSSFERTNLADVLADAQEVIVCGAETNYCIRHTVHSALERGLSVILVSDAHTCGDPRAEAIIAEQNDNFSNYQLPGLPGRQCVTRTSAQVIAKA